MESDPSGILRFPLLALKFLGRHPKMNLKLNFSIAGLYLIILAYLFVVTFLQYFNIDGDVYKFANNFEGSTAYIQMSGKVIFTITHRKQLIELVDGVKLFWNLDDCRESLQKELRAILNNTNTILKVFFVCIIATEVLIVMAPLFTKNLAVGAWTMEGHTNLYKLTLILQESVLFFILTSFTFSLDCVFLVLFISLIVQFKLLNNRFRQLNVCSNGDHANYLRCLKVCVQYHEFLLRYLKKLQIVASPIMLLEYATTSVLFCTEMYMFIESNNIQESIRRPVSFCAVLFQLAFYCIPADYVTAEVLCVSDAFFESNWISEYVPESRKIMSFVLQRSQQTTNFTAGGFVNINTRSLINVVKISWSVCTILRAVKGK